MSGPIVRTGATPKFWENWDRVFGNKKKPSATPGAKKPAAKKETAAKAQKGTKKPAAASSRAKAKKK